MTHLKLVFSDFIPRLAMPLGYASTC